MKGGHGHFHAEVEVDDPERDFDYLNETDIEVLLTGLRAAIAAGGTVTRICWICSYGCGMDHALSDDEYQRVATEIPEVEPVIYKKDRGEPQSTT